MRGPRRSFQVLLLSLLLLAAMCGSAFAAVSAGEGRWLWQHPRPQGDDVRAVSFPDALNGWAVAGQPGQILHTADGGVTWITQGIPEADGVFRDVDFIDSQHGFARGDWGECARTSDGGQTWQRVYADEIGDGVCSVEFIDGQNGWISLEFGQILHTTDGGETWEVQREPSDFPVEDLVFVDSQRGWAFYRWYDWDAEESGAVLLRTVDGGQNWTEIDLGSDQVTGIDFFDSTKGWLVCNDGTVKTTTNGGASWTSRASGTTEGFKDVVFVNATTGWAAGTNGTLRKSTDGGVTWSAAASGLGARTLESLAAPDATHAFVGGEQGAMARTTNGSSWTAVSSSVTNQYLFGADFASPEHGLAAGDAGAILRTTDGGTSWTVVPTAADWLGGVDDLDGLNAWAVGANGVILRSLNGGASWTPQDSGTAAGLSAVRFLTTDLGWAVGEGGVILNTTDGGVTWLPQDSLTVTDLSDVLPYDATTVIAIGGGGILRSSDGGETWEQAASFEGASLYALSRAGSTLVAAGSDADWNAFVVRSEDGGLTWTQVWNDFMGDISGLAFEGDSGWAVISDPWGSGSTLLRTYDGGLEWAEAGSISPGEGWSLASASERDVWLIGPAGAILKMDPATLPGHLEGIVRNGAAGPPLAGMEVSLQRWEPEWEDWDTVAETTTVGDGAYSFRNLDPGEYRLEVNDPTNTLAIPAPLDITVVAGDTTALDVEMVPAGRIAGTVRDAEGDPIAGATVHLIDSTDFPWGPRVALTDSNGRYSFPGAVWGERLGGIYLLGARHKDYRARFFPATPDRILSTPVAFSLGDVVDNRDITLPDRAVTAAPAPARVTSDETNKRLSRWGVSVRDRKAAWLEGSPENGAIGVGMADLQAGTTSRVETALADVAVNGQYLFIDGRVYEFGSMTPVFDLGREGGVNGLACDDSHAVYLVEDASMQLVVLDLADWSTRTIDLGEDYWGIQDGAVADGRVVVTSSSRIMVLDLEGSADPIVIDAPEEPSAVLAGGKVFWSDWNTIQCREIESGDEYEVYATSGEDRYLGQLRSDGEDLAFREWTFDWMADPSGATDIDLRHVDFPAGTVETLVSDPGPYEDVPPLEFAFHGDDLVTVGDYLDGGYSAGFRVDLTPISGGEVTRLDEPSFAGPQRRNVAVAGSKVAWLDDREGAFGQDRYSLYLRDMPSGAEQLISDDVPTHWDQPALSDSHLVYLTNIFGDMEETPDLYSYDLATGVKAEIDSDVDWNALYIQLDGHILYYSDYSAGQSALRKVDLTTGARSVIASIDTEGDGLAFRASNGKVLYQDDEGLWLYDAATGAKSPVDEELPFYFVDWWLAFDYPRVAYYDPNAGGWGDEQYGPVAVYDFSTGEKTLVEPLFATTTTKPFALSGDTLVLGDLVKRLDTGEEYRLPNVPRDGVVIDGPNVAFDAADAESPWSSEIYLVSLTSAPAGDTTPPATSISGVPAGWSTTNVTFSLTATDTGGSGVKDSFFRLGSAVVETYTAPVTVSAEGTTTLRYWSVDASGNVETSKTAGVRIDKTAPVTSTDATTSYYGSATVRFSVVETASGLASTRYTVDDGAAKTGSSAAVGTAGDHTLRFSSLDAAGNREATKTVTFSVTARTYDSVEGAGRYDTAVEASKRAFPDAGSADTIVLATGANWPDALGGASLAGAYGGPLLLTPPGTLAPQVVEEARRLDVDRVVILGSSAAVSDEVERQLLALDVNGHSIAVSRLGGAGRYDTAAMIASATVDVLIEKGRPYDGTAFFATGMNFPDALAASPIAASKGWPLLLVRPEGVTDPTEGAVDKLGIDRAIILGSDMAVPKSVADRLEVLTGETPDRVYGPGRYQTAIEVAKFGVAEGLKWDGVALAVGDNFPDALAGGVMQGKLGSVVLLTPPTSLHPDVSALLTSKKGEIGTVRYLGSPAALKQTVRDAVTNALK